MSCAPAFLTEFLGRCLHISNCRKTSWHKISFIRSGNLFFWSCFFQDFDYYCSVDLVRDKHNQMKEKRHDDKKKCLICQIFSSQNFMAILNNTGCVGKSCKHTTEFCTGIEQLFVKDSSAFWSTLSWINYQAQQRTLAFLFWTFLRLKCLTISQQYKSWEKFFKKKKVKNQ